jgi:hypothetical protein
VALGQVFSEYFRFPLPILIPPNCPSSQSPGAGTIQWPTCRVDPVPPPTMQIDLKVYDDGTIIQILCFWTLGTSSIDWAQLSRFYLKAETESSLRNVVF